MLFFLSIVVQNRDIGPGFADTTSRDIHVDVRVRGRDRVTCGRLQRAKSGRE